MARTKRTKTEHISEDLAPARGPAPAINDPLDASALDYMPEPVLAPTTTMDRTNIESSRRPVRERKPTKKASEVMASSKIAPEPPVISVPRITTPKKSTIKRNKRVLSDEDTDSSECRDAEPDLVSRTGGKRQVLTLSLPRTHSKPGGAPQLNKEQPAMVATSSAAHNPILASANLAEYKSPYLPGPLAPSIASNRTRSPTPDAPETTVLPTKSSIARSAVTKPSTAKSILTKRHPLRQAHNTKAKESTRLSEASANDYIISTPDQPTKSRALEGTPTPEIATSPTFRQEQGANKIQSPRQTRRQPTRSQLRSQARKQIRDPSRRQSTPIRSYPSSSLVPKNSISEFDHQSTAMVPVAQHRRLIVNIAEGLTQAQLVDIVVKAAIDNKLSVLDLLMEENARKVDHSHAQALQSGIPIIGGKQQDDGEDSKDDKQVVKDDDGAERDMDVDMEPEGESAGDAEPTTASGTQSRPLNQTQLNRLWKLESSTDWEHSKRAYLVPEGKRPPKFGLIPVGIIKGGKNVVNAGFDYRMIFHYRRTPKDWQGDVIGYEEGHDPKQVALKRDKVDLHPTLAWQDEEAFMAEVLKRQYGHDAWFEREIELGNIDLRKSL
ncbi:hypothetical protein B0O99DRAFT_673366 [Bisporella sp. PMI_857]|nr:hypothetical protein B0O99DRAFT_673366 [Bisporella sp. PMI_857]